MQSLDNISIQQVLLRLSHEFGLGQACGLDLVSIGEEFTV